MTTNFAKRAYDHGFPFDPIVRSLLDTDFYKILMHQFIYRNYFNTTVSFAVTNRTKTVLLVDDVDIDELRAQLDHVKTLKFQPNELIWLAGQRFYGQEGIFGKSYLDFLAHSFRLGNYKIEVERRGYEGQHVADKFDKLGAYEPTGQLVLTFAGTWVETTLWEIYALTIVNELRYRKKMRKMTLAQLDIMYARAKVKLYAKLERLNKECPELALSDFGTRRRHSYLWQEYAVLTARDVLGDKFVGTSNCFIAMTHGLDAKGTNAHELPMVVAALAKDDEELKNAQYRVLQQWQDDYRGALLVCLPDTFGTTQFLRDAPDWLADWTGYRPDSKKPIPAGEELISYLNHRMKDPMDKLALFSDGLDVRIDGFEPQGEDIVEIYNHFHGRVIDAYGWGTMLTNDFIGCHPVDPDEMKPISLVCKVKTANDRPAVKLSDNFNKATGPAEEVERYRRVFGTEGIHGAPVVV